MKLKRINKEIKIKKQIIKKETIKQTLYILRKNSKIGTKIKKTRSMTKYSTIKLTKQKGTGNARKGSRGSVIMIGGGKAFSNKKIRNHKKINKKVFKKCIKSILYNKYKKKQIFLIKEIINIKKTKDVIKNLTIEDKKIFKEKILIIRCKHTKLIERSIKNIKNIKIINKNKINPLTIIKYKFILINSNCYKNFFISYFKNEIKFKKN